MEQHSALLRLVGLVIVLLHPAGSSAQDPTGAASSTEADAAQILAELESASNDSLLDTGSLPLRFYGFMDIGLSFLVAGCQPTVLCDPGQAHRGGGCYPKPKKDSGPPDDERDASLDSDATAADSGGDDECPGEPYDGLRRKCTAASECSCHAPDCATAPLGYCTTINCDASDSAACPPGWTCLMIPEGAAPDPSLKTLCLKP